MTASYQISTEAYEGPIDLFYDLVVADRIDPAALSLTRLVEGFLAELSDGTAVELEHISEFLLVLALLCRLKARRMLGAGLDPLSEDPAENPDRDLWFRLARLTFRDVVEELAALLAGRTGFQPREAGPDWSRMSSTPELAFRLDPEDLAELATEIMSRVPAIPDLDHLALDLPTVEEAMAELWRLIGEVGEESFDGLAIRCADRIEVAAWFMGLLELAREGRVRLSQSTPQGAIRVKRGPAAASMVARGGFD